MARILYGVHGTGHGHAVRALAVARHFREHEFLFVSDSTGAGILEKEFSVCRCPNPETPISHHHIDSPRMIWSLLNTQLHRGRVLESLAWVIRDFRPDVGISDYEYFVPVACRKAGIPCLSFDHQHILPMCRRDMPLHALPGYLATRVSISLLFNNASEYLVTSFFKPESTAVSGSVSVLPPFLRATVTDTRPSVDEHVVAYQGYSTFRAFIPFLKTIKRKVLVYGMNATGTDGNLVYREPSEDQFLADLASCIYVICGGGHTLMSEALYLGKPVLSFPIRQACEQLLNAVYLQRLGYGVFSSSCRPGGSLGEAFEARLDWFRENIRKGEFFGNPAILGRISDFVGRAGHH